MARGFGPTLGSASSDKIATSLATATPGQRSYFIWAKRNGAGGGSLGRMFDHSTDGTAGETLLAATAASKVQFSVKFSVANGDWTITAPTISVWHSILVTHDASSASNDPVIYLDGSSVTVTEAATPSGTANSTSQAFWLGNRPSDSARCFDGTLAEFAVWDGVLLDAAEAAALGKGYSPLLIRPSALVCYVPMRRENNDYIGAAPTITGTAVQNHPRIILPRSAKFRRFTTSAVTNVGISPARVDLVLSQTAPNSILSVSAAPPRVDLALSTTVPIFLAGTGISPARVDLVLSPSQPAIGMSKDLNSVDLALSTTAPTVSVQSASNVSRVPPVVDLVISATAPAAQATNALSISPAAGNLALSPTAPDAGTGWDIPIGQLVISATAPTVDYSTAVNITPNPPAGDLLFSPTAPTVTLSGPGFEISPDAVDLVVGGSSPAIGTVKDLNTVDIAFSTTAPAVSTVTDVSIGIDQGNLVFSTTGPEVSVASAGEIIAPAALLTLSTTAPAVAAVQESFELTPDTAVLVISTTGPAVIAPENYVFQPDFYDLVIGCGAPIIIAPSAETLDVGGQGRSGSRRRARNRNGDEELTEAELQYMFRKIAELKKAKSEREKQKAAKAIEVALAQAAQDDEAAEVISETIEAKYPAKDYAIALRDIALLTSVANKLERLLKQAAVESARLADEDDIEVLLLSQ